MKEFEKYKLRCCKTCATDVYIDMCEVCLAMRQRKIGWRAALELVFGWLDYSTEHEEIKDKICKELE